MLHKLVLTSGLAFAPADYQLILGLAMAVAYMIVLLLRKPFRRKGDDRLQLLVQVELVLILYCGYAYQRPDIVELTQQKSFDIIMSAILISISALLVVYFFGQSSRLAYKAYLAWWYVLTSSDLLASMHALFVMLMMEFVDQQGGAQPGGSGRGGQARTCV